MADASPFDDFDADANVHEEAVDVSFEDHHDAAAAKQQQHDATDLSAPPVDMDSHVHDEQDGKHDFDADPFASAGPAGGSTDDGAILLGGSTDASMPSEPTADEMSFQGPTPLSIWEAERAVVIQQRIQKAKAEKLAAAETAKKEIAQFYQQREEALAKMKVANREEEKNLKTDMDALMANGTMWEKVGRLANVQPKAAEDRKVARMRKLLLQLKNDRVDENMKPAGAAADAAPAAKSSSSKKGGK